MAKICALLLALALLSASHNAVAADTNALTCSLNKVIECTPGAGCGEWTVQDLALPRFVRLDLAGKQIISLDKEITRTSSIANIDRVDGLTVMHGTELRGWTIALEDDTGDLTLSAAGASEGFIVFGSCIIP